MYVFATLDGCPDRVEFEERVALGLRSQIITICSGADRARAKTVRSEKRVALTEHWALWWDSPEPEPLDGAGIVSSIEQSMGAER